MAGWMPTIVSFLVSTSTEHPTPQYGQMVRVFSISPGSSAKRVALRSASAPVGQVWTHWPQKVQAESLRNPSNSTVICVPNPRFITLMAWSPSCSAQTRTQR